MSEYGSINGFCRVEHNCFDYDTYCELKELIADWEEVTRVALSVLYRIEQEFNEYPFARKEFSNQFVNVRSGQSGWTGDDADSYVDKAQTISINLGLADTYLINETRRALKYANESVDFYKKQLKKCEKEMGVFSNIEKWADETF